MNLSPAWIPFLQQHGHEAMHWSAVGDPRAGDQFVLTWARERDFVVLTHDLDFGAILAATGWNAPSVVQVRTQNVLPDAAGPGVVNLINAHEPALSAGAIVVLDETSARIRILPLPRP